MTALTLPRPRRIRPLAMLVAAAGIVAASQLSAIVVAPAPHATPAQPIVVAGPIEAPDAPIGSAPAALTRIDHSIAAWTANVATNDRDFISDGNLAILYEARARLSGDVDDYSRADEAISRSLAIQPDQLGMLALHARLRLATHEFARALSEAEMLDRTAPNQVAILAIIGDADLELGNVDAAEATYRRIQAQAASPAIDARLARVAFLRGDPDAAFAGASAAYDAAVAARVTGPNLSWYAYLAGTMALAGGAPEGAAAWFDRAIDAWPGSFLALAGRARADAAQGRVDAAVAGYRAAIEIAPQPDALTALGDLLVLRGDATGAEVQYSTVLAVARLQGAGELVFNRQLALFDINHDRDLATALALAERELTGRHDVYGYDAYAWALLANGRPADADAAMTSALALGTRDALLLYHAGEIKLALRDIAAARTLLTDALAIRGALDPLAASKATASLANIR
jgi:tetratricopeptide (TPR) repeat protein